MLYIQKTLPSFAQAHSHIEIAVSSQTRHAAYIIAQYSNMRVKEIDASLIGEKGIVRRVEELAYESGIEAGTVFGPVRSTKEYGKRLDAFHDPNFFRP